MSKQHQSTWGGRFSAAPAEAVKTFTESVSFDWMLSRYDIAGSIAHAKGLARIGILTKAEAAKIERGLRASEREIEADKFKWDPACEDVHMNIETVLVRKIGAVGKKLHTARSRNDQVATDLRLWLLEAIQGLDSALFGVQRVLVGRAEADLNILLPGYTHLQRAQPILLGHWWLSHFWPLQRDRERLLQVRERTASLPLGSGALAGTSFPVDRLALAVELGFTQPSANSLAAVSDRDFVAEFLFCAALTGSHLSRLSEAVVLFSSAEFGFFELSDAFATGSSLMPQKKNPDVFELARGKAGTLLGYLTGLMAMLKGLPSTYDKDLQEDKVPVFNAFDTLMAILPVLAGALQTLTLHPERMRAAIDPGVLATDLADYLVKKGLSFRQAHALAGQAVQLAGKLVKPLARLSLPEFQSLTSLIDADVYSVFDPQQCVARRNVPGGTAPEAVKMQLQNAKIKMQNVKME